jgi:nitrogen fixation protein FixH
MTTLAPRPRRLSLIPLAFFGAFGVVAAVNATMITLAVRSTPALVTTKSFERGKGYNLELAAAEAQAALGWSETVSFAPRAGEKSDLVVRFATRDGAAVEQLAVTARFVRPVGNAAPLDAELAETAPGRYAALIALPQPGQWQLELWARRGGDEFTAGRRITTR